MIVVLPITPVTISKRLRKSDRIRSGKRDDSFVRQFRNGKNARVSADHRANDRSRLTPRRPPFSRTRRKSARKFGYTVPKSRFARRYTHNIIIVCIVRIGIISPRSETNYNTALCRFDPTGVHAGPLCIKNNLVGVPETFPGNN